MSIVGALPNNIINGQPIDAIPVMADFNWIANQVNANAAGLAGVVAFTTEQNGVNADDFDWISYCVADTSQRVQLVRCGWRDAQCANLDARHRDRGICAGQEFIFQALATNTAAATVAVSGLATLNLQVDGVALIGGEILDQ